MYKYSVIIPLGVCGSLGRKAFSYRFENLLFSIDTFYRKSNLAEIIVVAQNIDAKYISLLEHKVRVIQLSYPIFNKGWCINVGVKNCNTDTVLISESEMWHPTQYLDTAVSWFRDNNYKWSFAWDTLVHTSKEDRDIIVTKNVKSSSSSPIVKSPSPGMFEGGIVMFDKNFFFAIGAANEFMQELGGIDNEILVRARFITGTYHKYNKDIYHLWHPRVRVNKSETRKKNVEIYKYVIKNTKKSIKILNSCITKRKNPWAAMSSFFNFRAEKK